MAIGKKLIDAIKNKKKKKTGTPKFAPGKGGGSDAARKGKGTVGKKKSETSNKRPEDFKRPKLPINPKAFLKRGGRAR